jgi:YihY family inner membrane protein
MAKSRESSGTGGAGALSYLLAAAAVAAKAASDVASRRRPAEAADPPAEVPPYTPAEPEGAVKAFIRRIDRYQRDRPWLAFPFGVVKKFTGDKAGYLAALVAYFGFFSLFPLMLAFTSILGFVVTDPADQREFSDAAADQIPVVGDVIRDTAGSLEGSVIAVTIGLALALWAGLRIVDAMQNAMNDVWDLPRVVRPKLAERRIKGILVLFVIGGGLVGSIVASNVAAFVGSIPGGGKVAIWAASALISVLLYLVGYQLLTDATLPWADLWPGAIFGGVSWWALQTFGSAYVTSQQESAGETYGQFASIIALFAFLFIAAQLSILGAEISVVRSRNLWPRSLVKGEFTEADIRAFEYQAASTQQDENYEVVVRVRQPPARPPGG